MPKISLNPQKIGRILLTRPYHSNLLLSQLLADHGFETLSCPLIEVTNLVDQSLTDKLAVSDIIIAVSANAVSSANTQINQWPQVDYIAVGQATALAFSQCKIDAITPVDPRTEGLLTLSQLAKVKGENILILRGNGGRETLAQQLSKRGAKVTYSELYRRDNVLLTKNVVTQWQHQAITTIVVTSAEILQNLMKLVNNGYQSWLVKITIVVPSTRVAGIAHQLGVPNIEIADGADNLAILNKLKYLQSSFYEK